MYPVCLEITGQRCTVVGGGSVAERKVVGLLAAGARVLVISPILTDILIGLALEGRVEWLERGYQSGDLSGALLVFAATDSRDVQEAVVREANRTGQLVNVIDAPASCSFQVPAVVRRGDLTLAVSTGGKSPAVAAMVRGQLEENFGMEYAQLLDLMAWIRERELSGNREPAERKRVFKKILHDDIVSWIQHGRWDRLRIHLQSVLGYEVDFDFSQLGRNS